MLREQEDSDLFIKRIMLIAESFTKKENMERITIEDRNEHVHVICPSLVTRISKVQLFPDHEVSSRVRYIDGDEFDINISPRVLVDKLGFDPDVSI